MLWQVAVKLTDRREVETVCYGNLPRISGDRSQCLAFGFVHQWTEGCKIILSLRRLWTTPAPQCSVFCSGIQRGIPKRKSKVKPLPTRAGRAGWVAASWHIACNSQTSPGPTYSVATTPVSLNHRDMCVLEQQKRGNKSKEVDTEIVDMHFSEVSSPLAN